GFVLSLPYTGAETKFYEPAEAIAFYRRRARRLLPLFAIGCFVGYLVNHATLGSLLLALTTMSMFSADEFFCACERSILDPHAGNLVQHFLAGGHDCGRALWLLAGLCCSGCHRSHHPTCRYATLIPRIPRPSHQSPQGLGPGQDR